MSSSGLWKIVLSGRASVSSPAQPYVESTKNRTNLKSTFELPLLTIFQILQSRSIVAIFQDVNAVLSARIYVQGTRSVIPPKAPIFNEKMRFSTVRDRRQIHPVPILHRAQLLFIQPQWLPIMFFRRRLIRTLPHPRLCDSTVHRRVICTAPR